MKGMSASPLRCVIDTNVAVTANGENEGARQVCVASSARALHSVMEAGHVFIDSAGRIVEEYRANLRAKGQPGPGDAFFKWLLTHEWGQRRVTQVPITPKDDDPQDFAEVPRPPGGIRFDPSDRKFLAVAAAHPEHPPILQSLDSKWWGWRGALGAAGITVHFLCEAEIAEKHGKKMGR